MKRSTKVAAPLLASAALAILAGCRKPEMQRCVDEQNRVVDDSFCTNQSAQQQQQPQRTASGGGFVPILPIYHYYYGGWGGFGLGSVVGGGSYTPAAGHNYAARSGVTTRGGFGSSYSGGSHGEGAGE
jgi:hypothetical protein